MTSPAFSMTTGFFVADCGLLLRFDFILGFMQLGAPNSASGTNNRASTPPPAWNSGGPH